MRAASQTSDFGGPAGTLRAYTLSGRSIQVIIQSSSVEECESREGPRDPEFSKTLYNVSVFKTSPFATSERMADVVQTIRQVAQREGATILSDAEKCDDPTKARPQVG